jgi:dynein heavy chain 2, cytosolic
MDSAKAAVGSLKSDHLSEVRSLKAPPAAIRDVLEAVLRLMGQTDTSWHAMKRFLATTGVKDKIMNFQVGEVTAATRAAVAAFIEEHQESFDPKRIVRVSVAAAPLAEWVKVLP